MTLAEALRSVRAPQSLVEQVELDRKIAQAEKMAALGHLAGGMAHEVNNPLAAVLAYVEVLLRTPGMPEDSLKVLLKVDAEARRLRGIVSDLLGFSRVDGGAKDPICLASAVDGSAELVASELRYRRVALERRFAPGLPPVLGSANQLKQVFLNLLINAMQALDGRSDGRIVVAAQAEGASVAVEVRDNGRGVPRELRAKIFEPFFTTLGDKGTGLGLTVSQGLIEAHGGRLYLKDEGPGAAFRVELPAALRTTAQQLSRSVGRART